MSVAGQERKEIVRISDGVGGGVRVGHQKINPNFCFLFFFFFLIFDWGCYNESSLI